MAYRMYMIARNYMIGAATFTAMYKGCLLWDAEVETYDYRNDYKKIVRPLFLGEKMVILGTSVALSPGFAPFWAASCLDRVDIYMRGKKPSDYCYGVRKSDIIDYMMA